MPTILIGALLFLIVSISWLYRAWAGLHPTEPWFEFVVLMQTGLGALLGFYGLMLVEAARHRNVKRMHSMQRRQEANEIATILVWEIKKLLADLNVMKENLVALLEASAANSKREDEEQAVLFTPQEVERCTPPPAPIFSALSARLGMRELQDVRQSVALFYEAYEETRSTVGSELGRAGASGIPLAHLEAVLTPTRKALQYGDQAVDALTQFLPPDQEVLDDRSFVLRILERQKHDRRLLDSWGWTGRRSRNDASQTALH
jgi:hypothetical protein